jgi:hypothetical protein
VHPDAIARLVALPPRSQLATFSAVPPSSLRH